MWFIRKLVTVPRSTEYRGNMHRGEMRPLTRKLRPEFWAQSQLQILGVQTKERLLGWRNWNTGMVSLWKGDHIQINRRKFKPKDFWAHTHLTTVSAYGWNSCRTLPKQFLWRLCYSIHRSHTVTAAWYTNRFLFVSSLTERITSNTKSHPVNIFIMSTLIWIMQL